MPEKYAQKLIALFEELETISKEGVIALGDPGNSTLTVDLNSLEDLNHRLRQITAEILAIQDAAERG